MCLLTFIKENAELKYEHAKKAAVSNPDGFGFAIHTHFGIIHDKDMDFNKLWLRWEDLRKTYSGVALWHFRIATHGTTNIDNCHPFVVNDGKAVLAHNGILPLAMPVNDNRSDTRMFAELVLPAIGGVQALDNQADFDAVAEWAAGNKIVILSADPDTKFDYYIINESLGHWVDDVWFSNSSYKPFTYTSYNAYSGYAHGYGSSYKSGWLSNDYYGDEWDDADWGLPQPRSLAEDDDCAVADWSEVQEYLEDELYPDGITLEVIKTFTEYLPDLPAKATCHNCGAMYFYDPLDEFSATHCGECRKCMACGGDACNCWEHYEYGQSYFYWGDAQSSRYGVKQGIVDVPKIDGGVYV